MRAADILRQEIRESGKSANTLAKLTGVKQQRISEFLRGKDIRLDTAQKLFDYFRLELKRKS
jgi:plasmid maintenance system antidote protein VapI